MAYSVKGNIRTTLLVLACALIGIAALDSKAVARGASWKVSATADLKYNTNIFKLSKSQKKVLDANSAAHQTSGRFKDMESTGDFILTPGVKGTLKTDSFNGNTLTITPSARYNLYLQNSEKDYLKFAITARQDLGSNNSVALKGSYAPDIFKKNYLTGTTNPAGPVVPSEKRYSAASYDVYDAGISYRQRLWTGTKAIGSSELQKVTGELLLGLQNKDFSNGFNSRDEDNIYLGVGADLKFASNYEVALSYLYKVVDTENGAEVLIRDEAPFGVDLNGNLNATDLDVETTQQVDRSHTDHTFGVKVRGVLNPEWNWNASYDIRFQSYDSTETFDITRKDRDDTRHRFGLGAKSEIAPNVNLALDWKYISEEAGRDALKAVDPSESKSYKIMVFAAALTYKF